MERNGMKRCRTTSTQWDNLPRDILETIFKNLSLGDRVRICAVCKYWNLVLSKSKHDILQIPDVPWKILSEDSYDSSEHSITEVSFKSLSDEKVYRFKLPDNRDRGWLLILSRLVAHGGWRQIESRFIPLKGSTKNLPPLSSHPRYKELVRPIRKGRMDNVFNRVQVFSHGSAECVVAAIISKSLYLGKQLSFCMPHDERWATYGEDKDGDEILYIDLIYREKIGSLWLLVTGDNLEMFSSRSEVCLSGCKVPILLFVSHCSGNGGILVVEPNYFGDIGWVHVEGVTREHSIAVRLSFWRFAENGHEAVTSIGNGTIFMGSTGTNSMIVSNRVKGIEADCVYLAIDDTVRCYSNGSRYTFQEQFVYSLKSKRSYSTCPKQVRTPAPSKIGWFEPKIL